MFFPALGALVSRYWKFILVLWGLVLVSSLTITPSWNHDIHSGEFVYLPETAPSRKGEAAYREAFTRDLLGSTAVIVVRRVSRAEDGLLDQDREFIDDVLAPLLRRLVKSGFRHAEFDSENGATDLSKNRVFTARSQRVGRLLTSSEKVPTTELVLIELHGHFLDPQNEPILAKIETLIAQEGDLIQEPENLFSKKQIPPGLDLTLSGPAVVGRDLRKSLAASSTPVFQWTLLIGVAGLLIYFRAPLMAGSVILNVMAGLVISHAVFNTLAFAGWIGPVAGIDMFALIVLAGLAVFASLLLISYQTEARLQMPTLEEATIETVARSGPVLLGGFVIVATGWAMLNFAEYAKFRQLSMALLIGTPVVFLATLTLLPATLCLLGRWALWPNFRMERVSADRVWNSLRDPWFLRGWTTGFWSSVLGRIQQHRLSIMIGAAFLIGPFAALALLNHRELTYGLLSQFPESRSSVKGAEIIQEKFAAGTTGPVTLVIRHPQIPFDYVKGKRIIAELSDQLERNKLKLRIADVRSLAYPLGITHKDAGMQSFFSRRDRHREAVRYFVGDRGSESNHVTKLEIVLDSDPFSRESIPYFEELRGQIPALLPKEIQDAQWHLLGPPASIRDLKTVTDRDRAVIQTLVVLGTFFCALIVVRQFHTALALTSLGGFNFLASYGMTFSAFWVWNSSDFEGLDWRVPIYLCVIQVVFSLSTYSMMLARIHREQDRAGGRRGLLTAMEQSGSAWVGGGLIFAGFFASLLGTSITGLQQIGFGLCCGALLDALLIRPWIIPAFVVLRDELNAEDSPNRAAPVPAEPHVESVPAKAKSLHETVAIKAKSGRH